MPNFFLFIILNEPHTHQQINPNNEKISPIHCHRIYFFKLDSYVF